MIWIYLAVLIVPSLIIYFFYRTGRRKPGYSGNGDITGALPEGHNPEIEDIRGIYDLHTNVQIRSLHAGPDAARQRDQNGF